MAKAFPACVLGLAGTITAPLTVCAGSPENKPHVILIVTDQHRWDAIGCAGKAPVISPNTDRLAADEEQLFDLCKDEYETNDLLQDKKYAKTLEKFRAAMTGHLSERGEEWVKDGEMVLRTGNLLYSPNYPDSK